MNTVSLSSRSGSSSVSSESQPYWGRAPRNVRVATSDDRRVILVHELYGRETTDLCTLALPAGARYRGCELVAQPDGRTSRRRP